MSANKRSSTSLAKLQQAEEESKLALVGIIKKTVIPDVELEIQNNIRELKLAKCKYEDASRTLANWFNSNGSRTQANEVRNNRLELVYQETAEVITSLNEKLKDLGLDTVSSVGNPSVAYSVMQSKAKSNISESHLGSHVENNDEPENAAINNDNDLGDNTSQSLDGENSAIDNNSVKQYSNGKVNNSFELNSSEKVKSFLDNSHTEKFDKMNINAGLEVDKLDPVSRRQLKQDLLRGLGDPYSGTPEDFWDWKGEINRRLLEAEVGPLDSLYILKANCTGEPKLVVANKIVGASSNPQHALASAWQTLQKRFGDPTMVANALLRRLEDFPAIKYCSQVKQLQSLLDLCQILQLNMAECEELQFLNFQRGMSLVWDKTPQQFQVRWRKQFSIHLKQKGSPPRFDKFVLFLEEFIDEINIPSFNIYKSDPPLGKSYNNKPHKTLRTETEIRCIYHDASGHSIIDCNVFKRLPYQQRKDFASKKNLCYACLGNHRIVDCPRTMVCSSCDRKHATVMHREGSYTNGQQPNDSSNRQRTERPPETKNVPVSKEESSMTAKSTCTDICGYNNKVKVCSKTLLVDLRQIHNNKILRCLCIIDEQSDTTFCDPKLTEYFNVPKKVQTYSLNTMSGLQSDVTSDIIEGLQVKGVYEKQWINLPETFTSPSIPDSRHEAATQEIVGAHKHIRKFSKNFPRITQDAEVLLLVGADCGEAMFTQVFGEHFPFVHKTALGFALVGPVCIDGNNESDHIRKTVKTVQPPHEHFRVTPVFIKDLSADKLLSTYDTFAETPDDDMLDLSQEDQEFIEIITNGVKVNEKGNLEMPLPLKKNSCIPDNKQAVYCRSRNSLFRLKRDQTMLQQCTDIMQKYLEKDQVEEISQSELKTDGPVNYVPVFPVRHKKKDKIRLVFDSSATYNGKSINKALLQGPDENNRIVGVMTRFRHGKIAFSGDIESMFHGFYVPPADRDLLRFYWWSNNNPENEIVAFRAKVHVFGNTSSPAIANFGLRYTTCTEESKKYPEACQLIKENFYVDDLLGGAESPDVAIDILTKTRLILSQYNLRLHKITANNKKVLEAFPQSELAVNMDTVDLNENQIERTLGTLWRISTDEFIMRCSLPSRQFTRRGVLSCVNSLYDPLGIISPVVLTGRLLQRKMLSNEKYNGDWDDPLPEIYLEPWNNWVDSLSNAAEVVIPRCFSPPSFGEVCRRELHAFADASDTAIGCILYLRLFDVNDNICVAFLFGNSKVAPKAATSIPRLELCAAVETSYAARHFVRELGKPLDDIKFYSDSKVVLGYLSNTERRFSRYVTSRVKSVLNTSEPQQWRYISTKENPADIASRPHTPEELQQSQWFQGPDFLRQPNEAPEEYTELESELPEMLQTSKVLSTNTAESDSVIDRICNRTTQWTKAKKILRYVVRFCSILLSRVRIHQSSSAPISLVHTQEVAAIIFVRAAQQKYYNESYRKLKMNTPLHENDPLLGLCPFIDDDGLIRVGGRLSHSSMPFDNKHPILLPTKSDVTSMILLHLHKLTQHQGRHITLSAVRQNGYHIHKGRRVFDEMLKSCVDCKKLRGITVTQKMADLPAVRLEEVPPFTNTGVDVFGPYLVHDGASTRRTNANKKVWATLFTCLTTRGIHIEPLPSLDTAAFRMALRRFIAIRGQCKSLYSDKGTNFVGAKNEFAKDIDFHAIEAASENSSLTWKFNPPAASHFGGVWERKVGAVKNVLNASLHQLGSHTLSRDELYTLLQEAASIVNDTPLYEISADPNDPFPLTPNMLLTLKDAPTPLPAENITSTDILQYGGKRWRRVQFLKEQFFVRWRTQFLQTLQKRHKWKKPVPCISIGDIVLIRKPEPRNRWPLGRVVKVEPGRDGLVRAVSIKTSKNVLQRCIHDLVLLIPSAGHKC